MKIAILGAGIGGLTMAQCLFQNGKTFDLFEASESIKPVGAGIWMPPNAMRVFERIGKSKTVLQNGVNLESMRLLDLQMNTLALVDGAKLASLYSFPTVSIKRSDLHSLLFSDLPVSSIYLGHQCQAINIQNNKTQLSFKNGRTEEYDLVIAADGINSLARVQIQDFRQLQYSGQSCFRALTKMTIPPIINNQSIEIWGQGLRFGCSPVSANEVYWYAPFVELSGQKLIPSERFALLQSRYKDFPPVVQQIIQSVEPESIIHTDLFELPPTERWAVSGLILLGDAAHAMTPNLGQGAAMAIEDAFCLAQLLQNNSISRHDLISAYHANRTKRVNEIAHWARQLGHLGGWQNTIACRFRNFILKNTPSRIQARQIDAIYGG